MRSRVEHRISRDVALLAVIGLHLLGWLLISSAFRAARTAQPAGPTMVWIGWPDAVVSKTAPVAPLLPQRRIPLAAIATAPAPVIPAPALPGAPAPAQPVINWRLEGERAAGAIIARADSDQRRDGSMGVTPKSPFKPSTARPSFPWSRQPLSKHFDADPHTGMISVSGKRCTLAFFLILPGFGCAIGPLDPEPGRGDLFDPRYRPQPLELPDSLTTVH